MLESHKPEIRRLWRVVALIGAFLVVFWAYFLRLVEFRVCTSQAELKPGDILFLPPLWFYEVSAMSWLQGS